MARVAVLVRTKDRPLLLRRALESIANQDVDGLQVVVVNDGGDAEPVERALDPHRDALGDLRVIHHAEPVGRARGMNVAVEASDADMFVFHDDDDSWAPGFLARTTEALEAAPDDLAVGTRVQVVWERVEEDRIVELDRELLATDVRQITLIETVYRNVAPPICLVYRRSAYDAVGGYDNALVAMADWDLLLRVLRLGTVGFIDEPLANWHHRRDSSGADSNSAYAERDAHTSFDLAIRDRYLRAAMQGTDPLGSTLFIAEAMRRLDRKADAARSAASELAIARFDGIDEHVRVTHLAASTQVEQLRHEIASLREQVHELHGAMLVLVHRRSSVRRARSLARRVLRGGR